MKKIFYTLATILYFMTTAQAQCPTHIDQTGNTGANYLITLTNLDQCANFAKGSIVTISSETETGKYEVANCDEGFGGAIVLELTFSLEPNSGTPIVLATSAPITFSGGGESGCAYNSLGEPITLPIELIEFKGTPSVSGNVLTWTTVREVSNRGFQVERLVSDKTWLPLTFVKSKGAYGTYQFTDYNPLSTSYYRLRQLDNDGKETFSKIVTVAAKGTNKLKAYPNPVSNVLTIETDKTGDFQVVNLLGQEVITGKIAQHINVATLPQGTYFLKVGVEQVKFVKQ